MTTAELHFGRGRLPVSLPADIRTLIIDKPTMPVMPDPEQAVRRALVDAVGCDSLAELASQASHACIAICDITRPVPNHLFLRPMIQTLIDSGMDRENIIVLVATGLHRPNLGDELAELVGDPWVLENVVVENHDARNDEQHITLGSTPTRGTNVRIDRRFVEADLRIATGLVEPHFMAGYSGGRKVIAPGLAHAETITTFHSGRFMADPAARNCNLAGNPLHQEQLEIVKMLGVAYAVNTIIDPDRNLSMINFGEIIASHQQAVEQARRFCEVSVSERFSTVVTSAAGYPLDKTYYQTIKGMVGALDILAPGGDLIIASECSEGMGSDEFVEAQKRLVAHGPDAFLESVLAKQFADIDEWQTQMQLGPQAVGDVYLYAEGLNDADWQATGVRRVRNIDQTIRESIARHQSDAVVIVPEGPYVVPLYQPDTLGIV